MNGLRISVSCETDARGLPTPMNVEPYIRNRDRYSFYHPSPKVPFHLDLTIVNESNYEIEVEFHLPILKMYDISLFIEFCERFYTFLQTFLNKKLIT